MSTLAETPPARRFITNMRVAAKSHPCASCGGLISKGEMHFVRPERVGRRLHSRHEHYLCPIPEPWSLATAQALHDAAVIHARPKPKRIDWLLIAVLIIGGLMVAAFIAARAS